MVYSHTGASMPLFSLMANEYEHVLVAVSQVRTKDSIVHELAWRETRVGRARVVEMRAESSIVALECMVNF